MSLVVLVGLVAAGGYAYFRYEWNRVHKVACAACAVVTDGQPYNVLLIGSDSRAGNTGQQAQQFGTQSQVGGQRSDTIKIIRVDPALGTAKVLSIPRDTYVAMSGLPVSSGLTGAQKINTAFNNGPEALVRTIQNTFGIQINHVIVVDFNGVIDSVNALGGINLDFRYPVRDDNDGINESGLNITTTGCQPLNGDQVISLSRSRYYQYYQDGEWQMDPGYDLSRIQRQDTIIEAMIKKAHATYNPLKIQSLISSVASDIEVDKSMTPSMLYDLAERYHAFSSSSLQTFTLPTLGEETSYGSDVEIVNTAEPNTYVDTITQFLGHAPGAVTTPPLDQYGEPVDVPTPTPEPASTAPPSTNSSSSTHGSSTAPTTSTTTTTQPDYDPTVC